MSAIGRFIVLPLCSGWVAAVKLGRKKRNGGNEFWRVNAIKTYPPRAVRTQVGFKSSVSLGTNKSAQFKLNNKNQYILYIYIINYFKGRLKTNFEFSDDLLLILGCRYGCLRADFLQRPAFRFFA